MKSYLSHTLKALRYALPLLFLSWPADAPAQSNPPWADTITSVAVSPDGGRFAVGGLDGMVKLWDAGTRGSAATFAAHYPYVYAVAFSPDGKTLATGGSDRMIKLWEAGTGRSLRRFGFHGASVESLAFSPDGRLLASGDHFGFVKLWDLTTGRELRALEQEGPAASHLTFSADGKFLVSGGDDSAFVWEAATWQRRAVFRVKRFVMTALTLSPDGRMGAASGCIPPRFLGMKCSVRVWDAATGRELRSMDAPPGHERLAFSPDGSLLAGANATTDVRLWNVSTGAKAGTFEAVNGLVYALNFDADAKRLTAVSEYVGRPSLVAWDVATRKLSSSPAALLPPIETAGAVKEPAPAEPKSSDSKGAGVGMGEGVGPGPGRGLGPPGGGGGMLVSDDGPVDYTRIFRASQVDEKARITSKPEPAYTDRARRNNISGKLRLRAVLHSSGKVTDISILSQLPFFLTDEALRAARGIKFVPATKDGRAVSQYVTLEYNFELY